jgi:hypothetical protein
MRRWPTYAAAAVLLAGTADGAWAQGTYFPRPSMIDLGVYAGGSLTNDWFTSRTISLDGTDSPVANGDGGYSPGYGPAFGALANLWLTPTRGLRLHGAYAPMRLPSTESAFTDAGERGSYVMNTYLYDLNLAFRPFAAREDLGRWLPSVYLFAGGGGYTVDLAGEDQPRCEGTLALQAACLSFKPRQTTVGQGTAGAGIDLVSLGRGLALFGEAAVHVYDSPVHVDDSPVNVDDEWLGPIRMPTDSHVRIADDAVVVTGRLVIGLKWMHGDMLPILPPPYVGTQPIMKEPPRPPPPPPPIGDPPDIQVCVVENGTLRYVTARYNTRTGDTTVSGRPFSEAYPAATGYAAGTTWFIDNEPIRVNGRVYVKYGLPRVLGVNEVIRTADFQGVPVFTEAGARAKTEVVYVPVRPGCEFQPYQINVKVGGVRGK